MIYKQTVSAVPPPTGTAYLQHHGSPSRHHLPSRWIFHCQSFWFPAHLTSSPPMTVSPSSPTLPHWLPKVSFLPFFPNPFIYFCPVANALISWHIPQGRGQKTFSVKDKMVNILFVGHRVSIATIHLYLVKQKQLETTQKCCVPINCFIKMGSGLDWTRNPSLPALGLLPTRKVTTFC